MRRVVAVLTWLAGWLQRDRARRPRIVEGRRHREQVKRTPPQRTSCVSGGWIPGSDTIRIAPDEHLIVMRDGQWLCVRGHGCVNALGYNA